MTTIHAEPEQTHWSDEGPPQPFLRVVATMAEVPSEPEAIEVERLEGLPLSLIEHYASTAARHAIVREVDPGVWVATIAGLDGVLADADTPQEALEAVREVVIGWVVVKRRMGLDVPAIDGIDLNRPESE